jgi:hypothetical protein
VELAQQQGDPTPQAMSGFLWWRYYWMLGDHRKAALVVDSAARLMRHRNATLFSQFVAGITVALQQHLRADPRCRETIVELLERFNELGLALPVKNFLLTAGLASVLSDGDMAYGARWVKENREFLESSTPIVRFYSRWTTIWAGLLQNEINEIKGFLPDLLKLENDIPHQVNRWICQLLVADLFRHRSKRRRPGSATHRYGPG